MDRGYDAAYAGWILSLSQATGIAGSLIIPVVAARRPDQRSVVVFLLIAETVGLAGLLFAESSWLVIWVSVIGFVLGGSFGLALLFIVLRSKDADGATELSGMAQSIGYLVVATGPTLFGSLFDFTAGGETAVFQLCLGRDVFKDRITRTAVQDCRVRPEDIALLIVLRQRSSCR